MADYKIDVQVKVKADVYLWHQKRKPTKKDVFQKLQDSSRFRCCEFAEKDIEILHITERK